MPLPSIDTLINTVHDIYNEDEECVALDARIQLVSILLETIKIDTPETLFYSDEEVSAEEYGTRAANYLRKILGALQDRWWNEVQLALNDWCDIGPMELHLEEIGQKIAEIEGKTGELRQKAKEIGVALKEKEDKEKKYLKEKEQLRQSNQELLEHEEAIKQAQKDMKSLEKKIDDLKQLRRNMSSDETRNKFVEIAEQEKAVLDSLENMLEDVRERIIANMHSAEAVLRADDEILTAMKEYSKRADERQPLDRAVRRYDSARVAYCTYCEAIESLENQLREILEARPERHDR